jgi:hypothetical protein
MANKFILLIIGIVVFAFVTNELDARNFTHILVKGQIFDETTKKPMGVEIEFRDAQGKKIKCQSNSISGEFQQVLSSNTQYTVILNNSDILRREFKFKTLDTNDYVEQIEDWGVVVPKPGTVLYKGQIYDSNNDNFSSNGTEKLEELQMLLRFNRELHVEFVVNSLNSVSQDGRVKNLEQLINRWTRENPRISIRQSKSKSDNDLVVVITKVKDFIKE